MTTLVRARRDALEAPFEYQDTGCHVHPACLSCPLPACIYDDPAGSRRGALAARNREIVAALAGGAAFDDVAARYGLHPRTLYRILHEARR